MIEQCRIPSGEGGRGAGEAGQVVYPAAGPLGTNGVQRSKGQDG